MIRTSLRNFALLASLFLGLTVSNANAAFIGSFGINGNLPAVSPTSGLDGATSFSIASMSTNGNATGGFSGLPVGTLFTGGTFTLGSATGFSLSNATYGTFTQTTAAVIQAIGKNAAGVTTSESFFLLGSYAGGAVGATPVAAGFTVSFTQTGGPGTSISASGTVDIPPFAVPEPASMTMLGLGLVTLGGFGLRRRMAK